MRSGKYQKKTGYQNDDITGFQSEQKGKNSGQARNQPDSNENHSQSNHSQNQLQDESSYYVLKSSYGNEDQYGK